MARNDFAAGFLQGLYQAGVGNPEAQRQDQQDELTKAYVQSQINKQNADSGLVPAPANVHPATSDIAHSVGKAIFGALYPGSTDAPMQTSFVPDPNAPQFRFDPTTGKMNAYPANAPAAPGTFPASKKEGMKYFEQQMGQANKSVNNVPIWQDPKTGRVSGEEVDGWNQRTLPAQSAASLLQRQNNQETNRSQPTSTSRSTAEFAQKVIPHFDEMRQLISQADAAGYLGPAAGRIYGQFLAGKVGSTGDDQADYLLGKLKTLDSFMKTGPMRVHFGARGGQQMYEHFSELLNTGKQSAAMLNGALDGMESFMQGYANLGNSSQKPAAANPLLNKTRGIPAPATMGVNPSAIDDELRRRGLLK